MKTTLLTIILARIMVLMEPKNVCMPLNPDHPNHGCVKPFLSTDVSSKDMHHDYLSSKIAYDNGKMNGFMLAERENNNTMSYYDDNKT